MDRLNKIRLLLVDDEEDFVDSVTRGLTKRDIEVYSAASGEEALQMIQTNAFDVVVLDVKMPGMSGVDVLHQIKQDQPSLPVVMLTGHGSASQAFETLKDGIVEYLTKPVDIEELTRTIKEAAKVRAASLTGKGDQYKIPPGTDIQVLLVDDEEELLASLSGVLKRRKMQIQTALDADAALAILRQSLIDVIVLDVKMPGMSGLELLKQIKRDFIGIEVILLTGHPNVGNALEGVKLGAFDYIEKPPEVDELARDIHRAFEHRQEFLTQRQQNTLRDVLSKFPD